MKNSIEIKKLKDIADIRFSLVDKSTENFGVAQWITASNLLPNNVIDANDENVSALPDEKVRIKLEDIIIRRIAPSYVNFIDAINDDYFAFNNLIIVRANDVDAFYLAYYLNSHIDKIIKKASRGTVMPTLGRLDLDEFEVALPSLREQSALGKAWYLSIERKKQTEQLYKLENLKMKYLLKQYIKKSEGR